MSEVAPIQWLVDDLLDTILDSSPEEMETQYNKLQALAEALSSRKGELYR